LIAVQAASGRAGNFVAPCRQKCDCQAVEHALVGNCRSCGKIICVQEGVGPCSFCGVDYTGKLGSAPPSVQTSAQVTTPACPHDACHTHSIDARCTPHSMMREARHAQHRCTMHTAQHEARHTQHRCTPHSMRHATYSIDVRCTPHDAWWLPHTQDAARQAPAEHGAAVDDDAAVDAATAKAVEAKDRLVLFDRTSTQRTTVIDDQSDYFSIDTNQWLTSDERESLKREEAEAKAADEARKKRVTVTFDLVGRKVVMDTPEEQLAKEEEAKAALKSVRDASKATLAHFAEGGGRAAAAAHATLERKRVEANRDIKGPGRQAYSDAQAANRDDRDFGWEIAHGPVTRRPPISLSKRVPRTHMYTYDAEVWDLSIVQGTSNAPRHIPPPRYLGAGHRE
jgi:hypothetical protein